MRTFVGIPTQLSYVDPRFWDTASESDLANFNKVYRRLTNKRRRHDFRYIVSYDMLFSLYRAVAQIARQWGRPVIEGTIDGRVHLMIADYGVRADKNA